MSRRAVSLAPVPAWVRDLERRHPAGAPVAGAAGVELPEWRDPRRRKPACLLRLPVSLQIAADVYAHVLMAEAGDAGRGDVVSVRVDGGRPGGPRGGPQARAAAARRALEAAIGEGRLSLGRVRGGGAVTVAERWLVRAVAVRWLSLREAIAEAGAPYSGHRSEAAAACLGECLDRMSRCDGAMSLFR